MKTKTRTKRNLKIPRAVTEAKIVNWVFLIAPWLTPVITAWLVFNSTQEHLSWGPAQAFVSAAIIEISGISSTNLVLNLYRMKAERNLIIVAGALVGVYAFVLVALTYLLDTRPDMAAYAPLLFVLLSVSSAVTVAVRAHAKATQQEQRKRNPRAARNPGATRAQPIQQPMAQTPVTVAESLAMGNDVVAKINLSRLPTRQALAVLFEQSPQSRNWTSDQLAEAVGCSGANVRKVAHRNGNGWEV